MSKCDKIGHSFSIKDSDQVKTLEICSDCGKKEVFWKQEAVGKNSKEFKEYMEGHKRDFIQPTDPDWDLAWGKKTKGDEKDIEAGNIENRELTLEAEKRANFRADRDKKWFS